MKKSRFILTAIAVLTVVGGALAFKAKGPSKVYCEDTQNGNICSIEVPHAKIASTGTANVHCSSTQLTTTCDLTSTVVDPE